MAIKITENGVVNYENSPDVNRKLFPNLNICGKEINELADEIDGKAPVIVNTASGSIASFDNGADDMPLKSCVVSFVPIQEGEGDPSPENVRLISGRTGLNVVRTGKNLLDKSKIVQGTFAYPTNTSNVHTDGYLPIKGGETYVWDTDLSVNGRYVRCYDSSFTQISNINLYGIGAKTFTVPINATYFAAMWYIADGITPEDVTIDQIELGSTATDYEPYKGSEVSVNWETEAGTVYGGTLDIVSGKLTADSAYIASYNGETLPSTWISDRDVYAVGTVPTTGAQVVYKLTEPVEYQLTPQEVRTLLGKNNIWSDAGDVSVESPADTKTYIDELSIKTVEVSGQSPVITAEVNTRYICGEVTSLTFTPSETGICDVRFTAASISTVLTLPETVKLPEWFDPTLLEANTTYEINIVDGIYGVVMSWV